MISSVVSAVSPHLWRFASHMALALVIRASLRFLGIGFDMVIFTVSFTAQIIGKQVKNIRRYASE